jgi:hypothetical protein
MEHRLALLVAMANNRCSGPLFTTEARRISSGKVIPSTPLLFPSRRIALIYFSPRSALLIAAQPVARSEQADMVSRPPTILTAACMWNHARYAAPVLARFLLERGHRRASCSARCVELLLNAGISSLVQEWRSEELVLGIEEGGGWMGRGLREESAAVVGAAGPSSGENIDGPDEGGVI